MSDVIDHNQRYTFSALPQCNDMGPLMVNKLIHVLYESVTMATHVVF